MKGSRQKGPGGLLVSLGRLPAAVPRPPFGLTWAFKGRCRGNGQPGPSHSTWRPSCPQRQPGQLPRLVQRLPREGDGGAPSRGCSGSPTRPGPHPTSELCRQSGDSQLFFQGHSNWASAQERSKPRSSSVTTTGATVAHLPSPPFHPPPPFSPPLPLPSPLPPRLHGFFLSSTWATDLEGWDPHSRQTLEG